MRPPPKYHPNAVAIGKRLALARTAKRYELGDLAYKAKVQTFTLRRIETGGALARTTTLEKLAPILEVDLDWLEVGTGKGPK